MSIVVLQACSVHDSAQALNQADLLIHQGKITQAETVLRHELKALDSSEEHSLSRARVEIALCSALRRQQKYDEAQRLAEDAVSIYERHYGPNNPEVAQALESLRSVYYQSGQYAKCEETARRALAILQNLPDKNDPRIEFAIDNVLAVACLSGQCKDEVDLYRQLLRVRTARFGAQGSPTCVARQLLAEALSHSGKNAEAIQLMSDNVQSARLANPSQLPVALNNLAYVQANNKQFGDALASLTEALELEKRASERFQREYLSTLKQRAYVLAEQGHLQQARKDMQTLVEKAAKIYGDRSPQLADDLVAYADVLERAGDRAGAAVAQQRAETIYAQQPKMQGQARQR